MRDRLNRLTIVAIKMTLGFFLFALGSVVIINCKIGVAPWDVLHQGLAKVFNITVGKTLIYLGVIIVIIDIALGQNIGWATILNMFGIGVFVDLLMISNLVPSFQNFALKILMIIIGIIFQGLGTYFYISTGYGAGPRDGLMVALTRKTGKPFGLVKSTVEVSAVATGYLLGGNFGIGTLIMAFGAGHIWQYMYRKMKFNISALDHRMIQDDLDYIKESFKRIKSK